MRRIHGSLQVSCNDHSVTAACYKLQCVRVCMCGFLHLPMFVISAALCSFYRASAVAASPVLATIGMSVRPSVRHTLALSENDAS